MRISSNTSYDLGIAALQQQQSRLLHTQQQISADRRILTPADDPLAAAQALDVRQSSAINDQYKTNRDAAKSQLSRADEALTRTVNLLQDAREAALGAGNGILSATDRQALALTLDQQYQELLSIANTKDGNGQYIFAGFQADTQPFAQTGAGVSFQGDDGQRQVQTDGSRTLATNVSGAETFQRIRNGNGTFVAVPAGTNAGTGVVSPGSVIDRSQLTGHNYRIDFVVSGATTTYNVVDTNTSTTVATAQPYTTGGAISFAGQQIAIEGAPANGDQFTVTPSVNQNVFKTLSDLAALLRSGGTGSTSGAAAANFSNGLGLAVANLDQALGRALAVRSDVGSRLKEIDTLDGSGEALGIQYQTRLGDLEGLDYAKAVSDLTRYQTTLQAAQQTFLRVAKQTLFDYL